MILIDSSIWISFFNEPHSRYAVTLRELIEAGEELCLADIVLTEVLQGISEDEIFQKVKYTLLKFPIFRPAGLHTYLKAAEIFRACRKQGKTVRRTIDSLIAAIAIENDLEIFHCDRDFDRIGACVNLKIYRL